jgi:glucosamine--fructose-6-phosphate aminotransferase (isomerizing)
VLHAPHADFTWQEIQSQPDAWQQTLDTLASIEPQLRTFALAADYEYTVVTGCGSTYYLRLAAAASLR